MPTARSAESAGPSLGPNDGRLRNVVPVRAMGKLSVCGDQPACKPGSVWGPKASRRPFLWDAARAAPQATHPNDRPGEGWRRTAVSFLFGLAPGGVYLCRFRCRSRGGLLPHPFTLTPRRTNPAGRSVFCGTVPGVAPAGRYPAPFLRGARTFLPRGLSALAAAVARPADPGRGVAPPPGEVKRGSTHEKGGGPRLPLASEQPMPRLRARRARP